jgi:steroid Delta-isomerase
MPTADAIRALLRDYCAAWGNDDQDAWLATFAPNATQEDPIGEGVRRGLGEIAAFWDDAMAGYDALTITPDDIFVVGREAAMVWTIDAILGDRVRTFRGVDVFTFTDDARISSVRAYWQRDGRDWRAIGT